MSHTGLWDVNRVAEYLGIQKHRAYELAAAGVVPSVRIGRQLRFVPSKIEQFVESGGKPLSGGTRGSWTADAEASA